MAEASDAAVAPPSVLRERKLAAVVFTDVVGYSAMVQADEAAAIERVRADLGRMRDACAVHGGDFLQAMGDGLMLAFDSAVGAVAFAMDVQEAFAKRNDAVPESAQVQHRIGIHVGDVFRTTDGLVAGDGVNIAARLQTAAPPGGVCVSQAVRDLVRGKVPFDARFVGARSFRNIADPIAVWHWHPRHHVAVGEPPPQPAWRRRKVLIAAAGVTGLAAVGAGVFVALRGMGGSGPAGPKSLAVLPFSNLSQDKDAAYFADGIHEDLLTQLALLGDLKVVSRTSVMEYRNTTKKVPQIASELGVSALVEGSVRRAGDQVRVTAQLVDGRADKHIWAANYDRDLRDIFKVQSELAKEIAGSLNVSLSAAEEQRLARAPTKNVQAYEAYLKHQQLMRDTAGSYRSITSVNERVVLLQKAVDLDPTFALAWAKLASERARSRGFGMADDGPAQVTLARQAIAKARSLTPDDPQVKIEEAAVHLHGLDDTPGSIRLYEEVLRGAPYNVEALYGLSETLWELNRHAEVMRHLETALSVDARHGPSLTRLSAVLGNFRHFERTLQYRQKLIDMQPGNVDLQAAFHYWYFWATGKWDRYDAWRPGLPQGIELRSARVRNIDADRAIARRDFTEVHRLTEVDSEDWKRKPQHALTDEAGSLALHSLAWRAEGVVPRATDAARQALARFDAAQRADREFDAWYPMAQMHAVLQDRDAAMAAYGRHMEERRRSGNLWQFELARRNLVNIRALLGDAPEAIAMLRSQVGRPGFRIHSVRNSLEMMPLWDHPDFIALVADPATNAPLPLDTPIVDPAQRT